MNRIERVFVGIEKPEESGCVVLRRSSTLF